MSGSATPPPREPHEREALLAEVRSKRERARSLAAGLLTVLSDGGIRAAATGPSAQTYQTMRDGLRDTVAEHARLMRQLGEPAEQTVVLVKEVAEVAMQEVWNTSHRSARAYGAELRADLVRWTIDAYYDKPGTRDS